MSQLRITYNAPFTLSFALVAIAAFILQVLTRNWSNLNIFSVTGELGFANPLLYPRLFLHVLGHASAEHLVFNLALILLLGPILEEKYGSGKLLMLAALTAVATGLIMVLFFQGYLLGASGIAFAFIILSSYTRARSGSIPLTFVLVVVIFLGREIFQFFDSASAGTGIAHFAHIIGGVIGAAAGFALKKP